MSKIQHLYEVIQQNPLKRKVLLTKNHAQGHQWLEQVSRRYGPVTNTEVRTIQTWCLDHFKVLLAKNNLRFLSSEDAKWVICNLIHELAQTNHSYISGFPLTPGLTNVFHHAVMELRGAGVKSDGILPAHFEPAEKGEFVKILLEKYENKLLQHQYVDITGLAAFREQITISKELVILDDGAINCFVEKCLLHSLTAGHHMVLCNEKEFTEEGSGFPIEKAEFYHASGTVAEAREVMRRIIGKGVPLDQVEIVASDREKNIAAIHTVSAASKIPCTYSDGLSISTTNAGKAARIYLDWVESGFHLDPILSALKQSIIRFRDNEYQDVSQSAVIRVLERSGIGWGRERYDLLEKQLQAENISDENSKVLQLSHRIFNQLFHPLSEQALCTPIQITRALSEFVENYASMNDEGDYQVIHHLQRLEGSIHTAGNLVLDQALAILYVREALYNLRVHTTSTPSPGHIHVTSLNSGGQTGRPYTFIIGMSESNWSLPFRQDPVLLDEERICLSPHLSPVSEVVMRRRKERDERIGMIRGHCVMSYCSYDLSNQQENMPAFEMLQIFRRKMNQLDADFETMTRTMESVVRYGGNHKGLTIDATEGWMRSMLSDSFDLYSAKQAVSTVYPFLNDGAKASQSRIGMTITPYDGFPDTRSKPLLMPGDSGSSSSISASKFELYGRCPLQYFYQEILGVRAKEVPKYDRTQWLNAKQRGSLLHEIFNRYLKKVKEDSQLGNDEVIHDMECIQIIMEQVIKEYIQNIPTPSEHIFHKEVESIRKDVHVFFLNEQRRSSVPVFTELPLHSDETPLLLEISEELSLPIRGIVDRVDQISPHQYKIYDYKTGSPRNFNHNGYFAGGTQLQLALYGIALEQWMKQTEFDKQAQVVESSYVFPTERGMGEEVNRPQDRREELSDLLQKMITAMKEGFFPPTNDPIKCNYCDYSSVCGSHAKQFAEKSKASDNVERLRPILEVVDFD